MSRLNPFPLSVFFFGYTTREVKSESYQVCPYADVDALPRRERHEEGFGSSFFGVQLQLFGRL